MVGACFPQPELCDWEFSFKMAPINTSADDPPVPTVGASTRDDRPSDQAPPTVNIIPCAHTLLLFEQSGQRCVHMGCDCVEATLTALIVN